MYIAVVRMPPGTMPASLCPSWIDPRKGLTLAAAFVDYRAGGQLVYREFLVSTTNAALTSGTILRIWVDSEASLAGGRQLWGIPKELASFEITHGARPSCSISVGGQPVASYTFKPFLTLPGRWRLPNTVRQELDGVARRTRSQFRTRLQLGSGKLDVPESSPVAFLRNGRVLAHSAMRDFTVSFGLRSEVLS
jgi:hypothetical protein